MKDRLKRVWKNNRELLLLILGIVGVCVVFSLINVPICPLKIFLGIPCPGCGISRALLSAVVFDFATAFEYNPAWPLVAVTAIASVVLLFFEKIKALEILGIIFLVIMVGVYIYRVIFTESSVVAWDFESGLLYRAYEWIVNIF